VLRPLEDYVCKHLKIELEALRRIARSPGLSAFNRNATTWELLLLLAANDGQSDLGVYNTLDQLETGYLGQSAMLKFLRDRRLDGTVTFDEHEKRSKWRLRLDPSLQEALMQLLTSRNHGLIEIAQTDGPDTRTPCGGTGIDPASDLTGTMKR